MGGVVNTVENIGKGIVNTVTNPIGTIKDIVSHPTTTLNGLLLGGPMGGGVGAALTAGKDAGSGGGGLQAPQVSAANFAQYMNSPLQTLESSGGTPLLMDIALGADVNSSLMGYFGATGDYNTWFNGLSPQDQSAVQGLQNQLGMIQTNTNIQNQAVQQLAQDYPNIMAQKIPQYMGIADSAMQKMMGQAMQQISAQQSANGQFSSGATAQAAANIGAQYAGQELNYATGLANQDFNQQFSNAASLQAFQQKMLGQGALQGFNAVQNALSRNTQLGIAQGQGNNSVGLGNAQLAMQAGMYNQNQQNAMFGALGGLAGTVLGGAIGGPAGAVAGGSLGGTLSSLPTSGAFTGSFGANPFSSTPYNFGANGLTGSTVPTLSPR